MVKDLIINARKVTQHRFWLSQILDVLRTEAMVEDEPAFAEPKVVSSSHLAQQAVVARGVNERDVCSLECVRRPHRC